MRRRRLSGCWSAWRFSRRCCRPRRRASASGVGSTRQVWWRSSTPGVDLFGVRRTESAAPLVRLPVVRLVVRTAWWIQRERRVAAVGCARDDHRCRALGRVPAAQGLDRVHRLLRVAGAGTVRHHCPAADVRAYSLGTPALPAHHRRRADADAHHGPRDAWRFDAPRHGGATPEESLAPPETARGGHRCLVAVRACCPRRARSTRPRSRPSIGSSLPIPGRSACCRCRSDCVTASARAGTTRRARSSIRRSTRSASCGGYISRLPGGSMDRYRSNSTLRVLLRLSEGTPVEPELYEHALQRADRTLRRLRDRLCRGRSGSLFSGARHVRAAGLPIDPRHEGGLVSSIGLPLRRNSALPPVDRRSRREALSLRELQCRSCWRSGGEAERHPLVSHDRSWRRRCHQGH